MWSVQEEKKATPLLLVVLRSCLVPAMDQDPVTLGAVERNNQKMVPGPKSPFSRGV